MDRSRGPEVVASWCLEDGQRIDICSLLLGERLVEGLLARIGEQYVALKSDEKSRKAKAENNLEEQTIGTSSRAPACRRM